MKILTVLVEIRGALFLRQTKNKGIDAAHERYDRD